MMNRFALIVMAAAAIPGCHRGDEAKPRPPTPVRVRVVAEPQQRGATRYSGSVEPAAKVELAFKVGGYVRQVAEARGKGRKLQEGDWVTRGTILAIVNDDDYRQKVSAARAAHAEAVASERQAKQDHERGKALIAEAAISQADYDAIRAKHDVSVAKVDSARAQVTQAELALADCTLRAPFDGVVIRRAIEVGTLASAGTPAYTIADTRTVKVVFGAPDVLLDKLRMGDELAVRIEALGKDMTGGITRIAPSADAKSRTFDVEVSLPNAGDQIKVGMIGSIHMPEIDAARAALALPLTAVVRAPSDPRGFAVFVVAKDDVARVREVKLGDVVGSKVIVLAGLQPGERVIDTGTSFVTDGEPVRVVR